MNIEPCLCQRSCTSPFTRLTGEDLSVSSLPPLDSTARGCVTTLSLLRLYCSDR